MSERLDMFKNVKIEEWRDGRLQEPVGISTHVFSGGEPHVNFAENAEIDGLKFVISVCDGTSESLIQAIVACDALYNSALEVSLFLPYLPGARQDRGYPLTAGVYATIINTGAFKRVICVDPHSYVMPGFIERLVIIDPVDVVPDSLFEGDGTFSVISPDKGARVRAGSIAEKYGLPLVIADKVRDPNNNFRISGYSCDEITTDYAVVIDDICDGGGTFLALAGELGMDKDKLRLWTTHGIYAKGIDIINKNYGMVGCTNSLPGSSQAQLQVDLTDVLTRTLAKLDK